MDAFFHGVGSFFHHLATVHWQFLGLAVLCHVFRAVAVSRAWFNIIRAAYPDQRPRWREIYGAYAAGVGVNAIIPARVGDLAKLYIAKRRIPDSTYTTLASTQVALTVFDFVAAGLILLWALIAGVLPGLSILPSLPSADWFFKHYKLTANVLIVVFVGTVAALVLAAHKIQDFWRRVARGFAVFRDRGRYLRGVALWQAVDWTLRFVAIYWFLRAFGIPASFHVALLVQTAQSLSTVFPFTPGGAGTEQALIVFMLKKATGLGESTLVAFAVGMKLTVTIVNVAIGFSAIAIMLKTFKWREAAEADKAAEARARSPAAAGDTRP
jgi:uncharacterized membrane protein YbhN (UPF0104 family)